MDPGLSGGWHCHCAYLGHESLHPKRMMKTSRKKRKMKLMWMTGDFVGCWWCCGAELPKEPPVGAAGGGDGSDGQEGIRKQNPRPDD